MIVSNRRSCKHDDDIDHIIIYISFYARPKYFVIVVALLL